MRMIFHPRTVLSKCKLSSNSEPQSNYARHTHILSAVFKGRIIVQAVVDCRRCLRRHHYYSNHYHYHYLLLIELVIDNITSRLRRRLVSSLFLHLRDVLLSNPPKRRESRPRVGFPAPPVLDHAAILLLRFHNRWRSGLPTSFHFITVFELARREIVRIVVDLKKNVKGEGGGREIDVNYTAGRTDRGEITEEKEGE